MKTAQIYVYCGALMWVEVLVSSAGDLPKLSVMRSATGVELSWSATVQAADGSIVRPYFEVQWSTDLQHWQPVGERQRAALSAPGQTLSASLAFGEPRGFYRLLSVEPT